MKISTQLLKMPRYRWVVMFFLMHLMFINISHSIAWAGPEGAQVVNGTASFQRSAQNTTITVSDKAIINYSSFDIARPETVQFIQPGSSASVLNRILSTNPTNINGTLLANGRVFFVNPAGVYIGAGARINVNQLVASGLSISNSDFINGRYNFAGGDGSVMNSGDISAEKVYLIGKQVTNSGNISCPAGYVVMAAGDRIFIGEPGSEIVLEMDESSLPEPADAAGSGAAVLNEGTVEAAGGLIALAAAGDIYSQAISNVGSLSTSAETGDAGQIELTAVGGEVTNTGTIEASGNEGGFIAMEGARVGQFGTIHADGTSNDGGSVSLIATDVVALGSEGLTTANAGTNGDGGDVIVMSPDSALFRPDALIEVKGGTSSGNGGFAEVSGREHVEIFGLVDATAVNGESGFLLIDPYNVTISANSDASPDTWPGTPYAPSGSGSNINTTTLNTQLGLSSVTITTVNGAGSEHGDITVSDQIDLNGGNNNTLTLQAEDDVIINAQILDTDLGTPDAVNITLTALDGNPGDGPSVDIGQSINTYGGNFTSSGTTFDNTGGIISTGGGDVSINHSGLVAIGAQLNAGSGDVTVTAGNTVTQSGAVDAAALTVKTLNDGGASITLNNVSNHVDTIDLRARNAADSADVAGAVSFVDVDGVDIAKISTTSTASVTAGDAVTQSGAVDAAALTVKTLNDSGASITLNNVSNHVDTMDLRVRNAADSADVAGAVSFVDVDGVDIAGIRTTSTASVTAGNTVTQSGAIGAAALTVKTRNDGGAAITLNNASNDADTIDLRARNAADSADVAGAVSFVDADGVDIAGIRTTSTASVTAGNTVTQSGAVDAAALTVKTLNDGGASITLNNVSNHVDTIDLRARNAADSADVAGAVSFVDVDGVDIAKISTTSTASVTAGDAVTQSGVVDAAALTVKTLNDSGASITLNNVSNHVDTMDLRVRNAADSADVAGAVSFVDVDGVDIAGIRTTSTASVTAGNTVTQSGAIGAAALTVKTRNDGGAAITLNNASNDADTIDLRARNAADSADVAGAVSFVDADGVDIAGIRTTSTASVTAGDTILVSGSISAGGSTATLAAAGNITINSDMTDTTAINVHSGTDGTGNVSVGAGVTLDAPTIILWSGDGSGPSVNAVVDISTNPVIVADTLTIRQDGQMGDSVNPWNPNVNNNATIDLNLQSHDSSIYTTDADSWQSVTATANGDITLSGTSATREIKTGLLESNTGNISVQSDNSNLNVTGDVEAKLGGVSLVADSGWIYSTGDPLDPINNPPTLDNVAITGYSDETSGVQLPRFRKNETGTAAIVIRSESQPLNVGTGATLTAKGTYSLPPNPDERHVLDFDTTSENGADPIDVAIYLGSYLPPPDSSSPGSGENVNVNSKVSIAQNGTMVIDSYDTVEFGDIFESSTFDLRNRLEVVSRKTTVLDNDTFHRLPYALNPDAIRSAFSAAGGSLTGAYVLRGQVVFAKVLDLVDAVPLVAPRPLEPEVRDEVEGPDMDAIMQFLEELGLEADMPLVAMAYQGSLSTDVRLYKAVEKLMRLEDILNDGSRIAVLIPVIQSFTESPVTIEEQMASFVQELNRQESAGQWVNALAEFVAILNLEVGQELETSMINAMRLYGNRLGGEENELFVEEYLWHRFLDQT